MREEVIKVERMFPNAKREKRKVEARMAFVVPKTVWKKRVEASWGEVLRVSAGTSRGVSVRF
jgi:hypothetical protein